ncbi:uncharacterized protein [Leptinotarsa decemlineata]|uniref:uncharacterized protein n=1 Tax=Leptinotarsa decemlineata TaxID=7539 RepID=UPI003D30BB6A
MTFFAVSTITMLQKRFTFLENLLKDVVANEFLIISQVSKQNVLMKIATIRKTYGMLERIVRNVNIIFGYSIFFGTVANILVLLADLNYIVTYSNTNDFEFNYGVDFINATYATLYSLSTVAIVMACNGVEKTGRNIVTICYLSHHVLEKSPIRDEILSFADFAEHLIPQFSAAGFFQVNQKVLSSVFSAVITYFIIIIQFNKAV